MRICSYGMGVNSTAMLVEAVRRRITIDCIITADTGDEKAESLAYMRHFSEWLQRNGQPSITVVQWIRRDGSFVSISDLSLTRRELPSKAYGLSGCTSKWKQQPIDKHVLSLAWVQQEIAAGRRIERWIGYDADEPERFTRMAERNPQPTKKINGQTVPVPTWIWRCPLVEWDMGREECVASIHAAGLPVPPKSSCFMCPSMKKHEILQMAKDHPVLMRKALAIEDAARASGALRTVKGLGRSFSWREFLEGQPDALTATEIVESDCGCYDGN